MALAVAAGERVRGTTSPNPPVGAVVLDRDGAVAGHRRDQPARRAARRDRRAGRGGRPRAGAARRSSRWSRARTTAALRPAWTRWSRPVSPACTSRSPTRTRPRRAAPAGCGPRAIDVHQGLLADEVRRGPLRAWLHYATTGRPHVTWKYAMTHGRQGRRGRRHQPLDQRRDVPGRGAPAAPPGGRDRGRHRHGPRGRPEPDRANRRRRTTRQPLRVVVGKGDMPPGSHILDTSAPDSARAHPGPGRGARHSARQRRRGRSAGRRPHAGRCVPGGGAGGPRPGVRRTRSCWAPDRSPWPTREWQPSPPHISSRSKRRP